MDEDLINQTINSFVDAAKRAIETDADGIEIHAAHGYLVNEFLSPFFNRRNDNWGGSDEKQFRFLQEIIIKIKKVLPREKILLVKLNTNDYIKNKGITPALAVTYAKWLKDSGVDAIEVSCGTTHFSHLNIWRGDLPLEELVMSFPKSQRLFVKMVLKKMEGKYGFDNEYNLNASKMIKTEIKDLPVILVGGARKISNIENIVESGSADLVSMCRPFIKEPDLVKKFNEGSSSESSCTSCNKCMAGAVWYMQTDCYEEGLPIKSI
jgi:2,4-dienoyl-CoA reductase-like NADH-dependent reductase (Old Yellow Enzyme family)